MPDAPFLAWIDLETTGLDPHDDPILEIGLIVTEAAAPFEQLLAWDIVVKPTRSDWTHRLSPKVLEMHTNNGLIEAVFDHGRGLHVVEQDLMLELSKIGGPNDFVLAGSGVAHFDRAFIAAQMPGLSRWLRYYTVDVGVLRRALTAIGLGSIVADGEPIGKYAMTKEHRGFADIEAHLAEMRFYAQRLGMAAVPPLGLVP